MRTRLLFAACLLTSVAQATVWNVEVGGGGFNGDPYYDPQNLTINQGDEVLWTWVSGQHNVNQTSGPEFFASGILTAPNTWSFVFDIPGTYEYECTQNGHAETQFGQIIVNPANGITGISKPAPRVDIYPNPVSDRLIVELNSPEIYGLSVLDLSGRVVVNFGISSLSRQTVDVSDWRSGIYFVEVLSGATTSRRKVIVR
jgi:plastocyanin